MGGSLIHAFSKYLNTNYQATYNKNFNDCFYLYDPNPGKREEFHKHGYNNIMNSEAEVFNNSKIIFTCVKPDTIQPLIIKNKNDVKKDTLMISILAGTSIQYLETLFKNNNPSQPVVPKIIRIMANHLCIINESSNVYSVNENCDETDEEILTCLLSNVGRVKKIDEKLMNAYTGLVGSGPAFVYYFIESLTDAGVRNGIDIYTSRELAIQTVYGSAKYMKENKDKNANNSKYIVSTPNGTAIAGLTELDKNKFKYGVISAVTESTKRGKEIEMEKMEALEKNTRH